MFLINTRKITLYRRMIQVLICIGFFLIYYTSHQQTFILGTFYSLKIGPVHIVDPYVYITYILRNFLKADFYFWTLLGFSIPLLISFILGRVFCSWMCPYNFFYEILDALIIKIKKQVFFISFNTSFKIKLLYLVLITFLGTIIPSLTYLITLPGLFTLLLHQITLHFYNIIFFGLLWLTMIFIFDYFFQKRIWCKFLCPTGILLSLVRYKKALRVVKREDLLCKKCALCSFECPLGLTPHKGDHLMECYNCGKCVEVCKELRKQNQPLQFKFL